MILILLRKSGKRSIYSCNKVVDEADELRVYCDFKFFVISKRQLLGYVIAE